MISRRRFLVALPASAVAARYGFAAATPTAVPSRIYLGTSGANEGILTASWDPKTGAIGPLTPAAPSITRPTFLAQHSHGRETLLYAVSEVDGPGAAVSALATQPNTSALRLLDHVPSEGNGPTHVAVSPDGRSVFVANYDGGSVSSFHVLPDGGLSPAVSHFQFHGSGPYKGRQDTAHTHSVNPSPDGRFLLVNDLGMDRIMAYHINAATSALTPAEPPFWSAPAASGPRHLAWNPNGRIVYCADELNSTVDTLAWDEKSSTLTLLGSVSSLPPGFPANTAFVGEIVASADGRNVYAGNRVANDTIAMFDVDPRTGLLKAAQFADGGGKNARHIALDPSQRWMVISHQNSNDLVVLERDRGTGRLSAPVHRHPVTSPMCVLFV